MLGKSGNFTRKFKKCQLILFPLTLKTNLLKLIMTGQKKNPITTTGDTAKAPRRGASHRRRLTPESFAALAVEHLRLFDLTGGAVLAGVGLTGVVAALAHAAAVQAVAAGLLQVEHAVVDVQHADAAHQTGGHRRSFLNAEARKEQDGKP